MAPLTIVIPVYNVAKELPTCLDSISGQECNIILVNDGSTDSSCNICNEYASKHSNIFVLDKANGGLSDARNSALPFIETDYTFFLDSDDWIDYSNLMLALKYAIDNNLDWIQCGYVYAYPNHQLNLSENDNIRIISKKIVVKDLINDGYIKNFAWGKIYKTSLIKNYKFPVGRFFEDVMWQYNVVNHANSFAVFPNVTTFYRQRISSISGSFSNKLLDLLDGMIERLDKVIIDYPDLSGIAALSLWQQSDYLTNQAFRLKTAEADKFNIILHDIIYKYRELIILGIESKSGLDRLAQRAKFNNSPFAYFLSILNRISQKLS